MNPAAPTTHRLVVCIDNRGFEASLELRKLYDVVPDGTAEAQKLLRIIDESGENYLYPVARFLPVSLPDETVKAVLTAA
jgi:hypothetical protein